MFPSCDWSQSNLVVGIAPMFNRSMFVASVIWRSHFFVVRDRRGDERRADLLKRLLLRTLNDYDVWEHVFGVGGLRVRRLGMDHPRAKIGASLFLDQSRTKLRRHVFSAAFFDLFLDRSVDCL